MYKNSENIPQSRKILDAAFKCISSRGYANVSLRDIADEAGVVLSQLNYYYKNKEGLFLEVIKMLSQQYIEEIEDTLKKGQSASENLSYLIKYFEELLKNKTELFKMLFDMTSMSLWYDSLGEYLNKLFKDLTCLIEKYIFNNISHDKLKGHSAVDLSRAILGSMFGTAIQVILNPDKEEITSSLSAIQIFFE